MNLDQLLKQRSHEQCELCEGITELSTYTPSPKPESPETSMLICSICLEQIEDISKIEVNRWRCLNSSIWSEFSSVKVSSWRMLKVLSSGEFSQTWAQDLLEQIYLEEDELEWAKFGESQEVDKNILVKDSNGSKLNEGDSVTLIKDLVVKGAGFTAKRGTLVKNIRLTENPLHIEGRVNGTMIVLVAAYLKKV